MVCYLADTFNESIAVTVISRSSTLQLHIEVLNRPDFSGQEERLTEVVRRVGFEIKIYFILNTTVSKIIFR